MDYAALVWGSARVTALDELQGIQTKTFEKVKGLDDAELHKKANVQFLDCTRNEQLLISLFNVLVLGQEPFSNVIIKYNDLRYSTRTQQKDLPKPNTNYLKQTVTYRAMTLWNKMPECIRKSDSKKSLKTFDRKYYLENM